MEKTITILERISDRSGRIAGWMTTFLVWLVFLDVVIRYLFNFTFIWMVELETYFFAIGFLFASGYAFKEDYHVRVDLFYAKSNKKQKAWTNLLGGLLFLMPWTIVAMIVCFNYFLTSYGFRETSSQPGGLPALYILKFFLFLGFAFLFIQGLASIMKSFLTVSEGNKMKNE